MEIIVASLLPLSDGENKMKQSWESYENTSGPVVLGIKIVVGFAIVAAVIGGIGYAFSWCGETASVVQQEVGPKAILQKYMLLKEMHAQLDKKLADIKVYQGRLKSMEESYNGQSRSKWAREDREQYNVWSSEVAGVKASYNELAAQYNAKMAEVNWSFANVGQLPQGATEVLPRSYAPYIEQ